MPTCRWLLWRTVALAKRECHSASIRCKTYCELLVLHKNDFDYVTTFYTELYEMLYGVATARKIEMWHMLRQKEARELHQKVS